MMDLLCSSYILNGGTQAISESAQGRLSFCTGYARECSLLYRINLWKIPVEKHFSYLN